MARLIVGSIAGVREMTPVPSATVTLRGLPTVPFSHHIAILYIIPISEAGTPNKRNLYKIRTTDGKDDDDEKPQEKL
jgi:hypothetical protein